MFTSASIILCSYFLSRPAMCCNPSSGVVYSKAIQLHYSGQYSDWRVLWLACSPTAGQYFQRLWDCSASPEICLHFPATPYAQRIEACAASPPASRLSPIWKQPLSKLFTKAFLFAHHKWHLGYSISFLFLYTTNPCCSSMCLAIWAGVKPTVISPSTPRIMYAKPRCDILKVRLALEYVH